MVAIAIKRGVVVRVVLDAVELPPDFLFGECRIKPLLSLLASEANDRGPIMVCECIDVLWNPIFAVSMSAATVRSRRNGT